MTYPAAFLTVTSLIPIADLASSAGDYNEGSVPLAVYARLGEGDDCSPDRKSNGLVVLP